MAKKDYKDDIMELYNFHVSNRNEAYWESEYLEKKIKRETAEMESEKRFQSRRYLMHSTAASMMEEKFPFVKCPTCHQTYPEND